MRISFCHSICHTFGKIFQEKILSLDLKDNWVWVMDQGDDEEKWIQKLLDHFLIANIVFLRELFGGTKQYLTQYYGSKHSLAACLNQPRSRKWIYRKASAGCTITDWKLLLDILEGKKSCLS